MIPSELDGWVDAGELHVEQGAEPRAPLDRLMRTAAKHHGRETAGIVLGGEGADGLIGIRQIKDAGGITIARHRDPATRTDLPVPRGLGVGLNVVRRLVELDGGSVTADRAGEGCGGEFVVELLLGGLP